MSVVLPRSWLSRSGNLIWSYRLPRLQRRRWASTSSDEGQASNIRLFGRPDGGDGKTSPSSTAESYEQGSGSAQNATYDVIPAKDTASILQWDVDPLHAFDPYGGFFPKKDVETHHQLPETASEDLLPIFRTRSPGGSQGPDLSHLHPLGRPMTREQILYAELSRATNDMTKQTQVPLQFRANRNLRKVVMRWCGRVAASPRYAAMNLQAQLQSAELRQEAFDGESIAIIARSPYTPEDIITWSWILMAGNTKDLVKRFLKSIEEMRRTNNAAMAHFVVLQILRAKHFPPDGFRAIVRSLCGKWMEDDPTLEDAGVDTSAHVGSEQKLIVQWKLEKSTLPEDNAVHSDKTTPTADPVQDGQRRPVDVYSARHWDVNANALLLIRLLRHARIVAPDTFDDIITIAFNRLFDRPHKQNSQLADICNRLLKMLAIQLSVVPGRLVHYPKNAQIRLLRKMVTSTPEIPLSREGYRSLISVQLAQPKTEDEIAWARTKSLSWPPWRVDKLGIDQLLTYPGKETRAYKLLRRMNEAGYAHGAWEQAAKIYSGWDTDDSPTIQTRKHLMVRGQDFDDISDVTVQDNDPFVWTARIEATRSVREAWAAFLTYRAQMRKAGESPSRLPYEAMFRKLFAPRQPSHFSPTSVPGDAWNVWPDSRNPLEVIYIPQEVPSIEQFYEQMRQDGIQATGGLLSNLVRSAPSLDLAFRYLKEGLMSPTLRKMLLRNYIDYERSPDFEVLEPLSPRMVAAVIERLMADSAGSNNVFMTTNADFASDSVKPALWGMALLRQVDHRDSPMLYNRALDGLLQRVKSYVFTKDGDGRAFFKEAWYQIREILMLMRDRSIFEDGRTYVTMVELYMHMLNKGPWPSWKRTINPVNWSKGVFARWIYGTSDNLRWISPEHVQNRRLIMAPTSHEIRALVEILGTFGDDQGILELLVWTAKNAAFLQKAHSDMRLNWADMRMEHIHTVARIFVEKMLEDDNGVDIEKQLQALTSLHIDMPSREACIDFMRNREGWTRRHDRYRRLRAWSNKDWHITEAGSGLD